MSGLGLDPWWNEPAYKTCNTFHLRGLFILRKLREHDSTKFHDVMTDLYRDDQPDPQDIGTFEWQTILAFMGATEEEIADVAEANGAGVAVTGPSGRSPNRRHDRQHFYKYVSAKTAKAILTTRKLRWSSPVLFNDPFDVTQELRLNFDVAALSAALVEEMADLIVTGGPVQEAARQDLKALLATLDGASLAQRQRMADRFRKGPPKTTVGQVEALAELRRRWSEIVPNLRVLCLSEANDVTSMWNHYADSYRGVLLQFEAVDELDSVWLLARPVVYQAAPPAIADARTWARCMLRKDKRTYLDLFTEYQYTKTPDWAYEREWRIATFALPEEFGEFSYWAFNPRELVGVYLGPRCSGQDQTDILALLTNGFEEVSVFRARITGAAGKFTFQTLPEPS